MLKNELFYLKLNIYINLLPYNLFWEKQHKRSYLITSIKNIIFPPPPQPTVPPPRRLQVERALKVNPCNSVHVIFLSPGCFNTNIC